MRFADEATEALTLELGRLMVQRAAPAEAVMFTTVSRAFFKNPRKALAARQDSTAGRWGFGMGDEVELLTPALLKASLDIVAYMAEQGVTRNGPVTGDAAMAALTAQQRTRVRGIVEEALCEQGAPRARAVLIADAAIGDNQRS